jgi:16S rRNA processing protein RimM
MSDAPSTQQSRRVLLGQIAGVHGIRGHVLVRTYTAEPSGIANYGPLENKAANRTFKLKIIRTTDKGVVAAIDGIADRTAAEGLRGTDLYVLRSQLPAAAVGEYYHHDLIGLKAVSTDGTQLGTVIAVQNYGAGDLLEVQNVGQSQTDLIPMTSDCVPEIDLDRGIAVINPPLLVDDDEALGSDTEVDPKQD